jgi:hypothetical protein
MYHLLWIQHAQTLEVYVTKSRMSLPVLLWICNWGKTMMINYILISTLEVLLFDKEAFKISLLVCSASLLRVTLSCIMAKFLTIVKLYILLVNLFLRIPFVLIVTFARLLALCLWILDSIIWILFLLPLFNSC